MSTKGRTDDLRQKRCKPCEGDAEPMSNAEAQEMLESVQGWELQEKSITRTFEFKNFYRTMSFVNAVAWIANREDHHPDLQVGYGSCTVTLSTHSIGGLSENDFISAAKVNALIED